MAYADPNTIPLDAHRRKIWERKKREQMFIQFVANVLIDAAIIFTFMVIFRYSMCGCIL